MNELNNISSVPPCFGCGACYNTCPKDAIRMALSEEGFWEPQVDAERCINCGLCRKACPKLNEPQPTEQADTFYGGWSKHKDTVSKSSSGGIFGELAEAVLRKGGVVYGAVWAREGIHHTRIDDLAALPALMGSKYGQSNTEQCYRQAKADLKNGKQVLFAGTPCQVAGLKTYLGKEYESLLTADIVCHGVPTRHIEEKFLSEQEQGKSPVTLMRYRDKSLSWRRFSVVLERADEAPQREECYFSPFMRAFASDIALNETCYTCPFRLGTYQSDLTLGDCWGVTKYKQPFWNHENGISVIVAHSDKGRNALKVLPCTLHQVSKETAVGFNGTLRKLPTETPARRQDYLRELGSGKKLTEVNELYIKGFKPKYDVALIGMWMGLNYGAVLNAVALYKAVRDMGYSVVMFDERYRWPHNDHGNVFWQFLHSERVVTAAVPTLRSLNNAAANVNTLLVGSDQVWNPACMYEHYYQLDFAKPAHRKVSYASSFGNSRELYTGDFLKRSKAYLQRFDAVSVREHQGVQMLGEMFGVHRAEHVTDPVFLRSTAWWSERADKGDAATDTPYVLAYILDPSPQKQEAIIAAAKAQGISKIIYIVDLGAPPVKLIETEGITASVHRGISLFNWLKLIRDARLVITDSFHGTCFAIIFGRDFYAIGNTGRGVDRFTSLLGKLELQDRLLAEKDLAIPALPAIDYARVGGILKEWVAASTRWLQTQLAATDRSPELEELNRRVAAEFPPHRSRKKEIELALIRKFPEFFKKKEQLRRSFKEASPALYATLRKWKRKLVK